MRQAGQHRPLVAVNRVEGELALIDIDPELAVTTHGRLVVNGECKPQSSEDVCPALPYGLQWLLQHVILASGLKLEQVAPLLMSFRQAGVLFDGDFGLAS